MTNGTIITRHPHLLGWVVSFRPSPSFAQQREREHSQPASQAPFSLLLHLASRHGISLLQSRPSPTTHARTGEMETSKMNNTHTHSSSSWLRRRQGTTGMKMKKGIRRDGNCRGFLHKSTDANTRSGTPYPSIMQCCAVLEFLTAHTPYIISLSLMPWLASKRLSSYRHQVRSLGHSHSLSLYLHPLCTTTTRRKRDVQKKKTLTSLRARAAHKAQLKQLNLLPRPGFSVA